MTSSFVVHLDFAAQNSSPVFCEEFHASSIEIRKSMRVTIVLMLIQNQDK